MAKYGDQWLEYSSHQSNEGLRAPLQGNQLQSGSCKSFFEANTLLESINASTLMGTPESPGSVAFGKDLQGFQTLLEQKSLKSYYSNPLAGGNGDFGQRSYCFGTASMDNGQLPWTPSTESGAWDQEGPQSENLVSIQIGTSHLSFLGQSNQTSFANQIQRLDVFEGTSDSLHSERSALAADQNSQDLSVPVIPRHLFQKATFIDSPHASGLSKEVSDRDIKQEIRADSSECSDPMEDDEEKGVPRSGRRHLSKNLVAERKRRKKLNERLYLLRALVPKITKMDRASILGDAIEYVKELQQKVKELQEELLDTKEDEMQPNVISSPREDGGHLVDEDGSRVVCVGEDTRFSIKLDPLKVSCDIGEKRLEDLNQPMQVEVSKMDGQIFSLRIFCEKRPGVFVKLMQALDVLGLDILHANITTFRGLVLNVFNAEIRDRELVQAEQVKESLLEMTSRSEYRTTCILGDIPIENDN